MGLAWHTMWTHVHTGRRRESFEMQRQERAQDQEDSGIILLQGRIGRKENEFEQGGLTLRKLSTFCIAGPFLFAPDHLGRHRLGDKQQVHWTGNKHMHGIWIVQCWPLPFFPQIRICLDELTYATLWSRHEIIGPAIEYKDITGTRPSFKKDVTGESKLFPDFPNQTALALWDTTIQDEVRVQLNPNPSITAPTPRPLSRRQPKISTVLLAKTWSTSPSPEHITLPRDTSVQMRHSSTRLSRQGWKVKIRLCPMMVLCIRSF